MQHYKNLDLTDIVYFCEFDLIEKTEQWKDILNYEGIYQVSDLGRIKSLKRKVFNQGLNPFYSKPKILKTCVLKNGYASVALRKNNKQKSFTVHTLVAFSFLNHKPCGFKFVVNHKNFDKTYNNKLNLEIVTNRENSNQKHLPSTSKYVGVSFNIKSNKWQSHISYKGKTISLGYFIDEEEASLAYQKKINKIINEERI